MNRETRTDPDGAEDRLVDDEPIHLRLWGTERVYELPTPTLGKHWIIGASKESWLRMQDAGRFVSRRHAALVREREGWFVRDVGSKNGTFEFSLRRTTIAIVPGVEIGIGANRLVVESPRIIRLRALFARMLGWDDHRARAIDRAVRAVRESAASRFPLYVAGDGDLVMVARRIHREVLGAKAPFIVSDPRRANALDTSRSPRNYVRGADAIEAAAGGSVCIWSGRLPADYLDVVARIDRPDTHVRLIVCTRTVPVGAIAIQIPPISSRRHELDRMIREYAAEAIAALGTKRGSFTDRDMAWLLARRPSSLAEIERATLRLVALREGGNVTRAAALLGITHGTLSRWIGGEMP